MQSGKPVGVFRTHADAPRVLIANSNLVPHWATLGALQRARPQGPDDVRPDDRRLVDLHRQPGHRAGHLRDVRRGGPPALRRRPRRQMDPHRRPRRHGRRAAARGDDGRRLDARHRMPAERASRCACDGLSRPPGRHARRGAGDHRARLRARRSRSRSACSAMRRISCRARCARGVRPDVVTDQTSRARSGQRLSAEGLDARRVGSAARERSRRASSTPRKRSMAEHVRAMLAFHARGRPDVRLRQQHPPDGAGRRRRRRVRLSRASCRPTSGRCSAAASGRSAGPRCRAIPRTSTAPTPR